MRAFERTAGELGLATLRCIAVHGADVVWRRLGWAPSDAAVPPDYPPGSLAMVRTTPPEVRRATGVHRRGHRRGDLLHQPAEPARRARPPGARVLASTIAG